MVTVLGLLKGRYLCPGLSWHARDKAVNFDESINHSLTVRGVDHACDKSS